MSNKIQRDSKFHFIKKRSAGADWGYSIKNGPSTWGGVCNTGKYQSPINIELGKTIAKDFPPFSFSEDYLNKHKLYVKNNGHTVQVSVEKDSVEPVISGGGLKDKFIFKQLHFHWESEHEFDGKRADLEMHVVHYNSKYKSFEEAVTKPDGIAVLAVIFDEKKETNPVIDSFFDFILEKLGSGEHQSYTPPPNNLLPEDDEDKKSASFALRDLLPKQVSMFFRYNGSLTTPDCQEVVQWTVFISRLPVSSKPLKVFRTLKDHDGNTLLTNFRPPEKLNGREVYIQLKNFENTTGFNCENLVGKGTSINSLMTLYPSLMVFCSYLIK